MPGTERQLGACGLFRPSPSQQDILPLPTGPLAVRGADPDILWVGFAELCSGSRTTADYLLLAQRFQALLDVLHGQDITPFLIVPGPLGSPFGEPEGSAHGEAGAVLSLIGKRLSMLRRIESDEQLADEQSGGC